MDSSPGTDHKHRKPNMSQAEFTFAKKTSVSSCFPYLIHDPTFTRFLKQNSGVLDPSLCLSLSAMTSSICRPSSHPISPALIHGIINIPPKIQMIMVILTSSPSTAISVDKKGQILLHGIQDFLFFWLWPHFSNHNFHGFSLNTS